MGYSRSDVQATKNRMKKFVRYKVGAEMYSIHYNYKPKNMNSAYLLLFSKLPRGGIIILMKKFTKITAI